MTVIEALRILKLAPGPTPEQVQGAHGVAFQRLQIVMQFAQAGPDRDAKVAEMAALNEAYTVLTRGSAAGQVAPSQASARAGRSTTTFTPPRGNSPAASPRPTPAPPAQRPSPASPPVPHAPVSFSPGWRSRLSAFFRQCRSTGTAIGGALLGLLQSLKATIASARVPQVVAVMVFVVMLLCAVPVSRWVSSRASAIGRTAVSVTNDHELQQVSQSTGSAASVPLPAPSLIMNVTGPRPAATPDPPGPLGQPESVVRTPPPPVPLPRAAAGGYATSVGWLIVKSSPWARVELDGRFVDDAPWLSPKEMSARVYTVTLITESGKRVERQVEIRAGRTTVVTWILKKDRFTVMYEGEP